MLVNDDILLDAGTGVGDLSIQQLRQIRHVFLTHSHLDHIASLPLFLDCIFDSLNGEMVTIHAREETIQALRDHIFNWVIWPDFTQLPSPENPVMKYSAFNPDQDRALGDITIRSVEVEHTVPSQGYVLSGGTGAFAISGDTSTNKTLWPRLNATENLTTLVVEVSFPNELAELARQSGHYVPETMARDLEKLQHDPDIWLNAMKPGEESRILQQVQEALPGREIRMLERGVEFQF